MSINEKPHLSYSIKDAAPFSKKININNFSIFRNSMKEKNLTDNKHIGFEVSNCSRLSSNNFSKYKKNPVLAQREAEYDKNLKRIKSNLLNKFNSYSLLNGSAISQSNEKHNIDIIDKKNLRRERSRYNIKTYSPSIIKSKKYIFLEDDKAEYKDRNFNDNHPKKDEGLQEIKINKEANNKENKNKKIIISMRLDEKENYENDNYDSEKDESGSKGILKKKRFAKKIINDKNNTFTLDTNDISVISTTNTTSKKNKQFLFNKLNGVKQGIELNTSLFNKKSLIMTNNNDKNFSSKRLFHTNNKSATLTNKKSKGFLSVANTTKHTMKKFLFKNIKRNDTNEDNLDSPKSSMSKLSKIKNNDQSNNLIEEHKNKSNIAIGNYNVEEQKNFSRANNECDNYRMNYCTNLIINGKSEINFDDDQEMCGNSSENEKAITSNPHNRNENYANLSNAYEEHKNSLIDKNKESFAEQIEKNYKEFLKEHLDCSDISNGNTQAKESEINSIQADNPLVTNNPSGENIINSNNNKKFIHIRKNSGLEIIQENHESENLRFNTFNYNNNINNLDSCYSKYNSNQTDYFANVFNNKNVDKNCSILESGGLSKKFSEMKKTLSNNLNNINNNFTSQTNQFSDYKFQSLLNNKGSERFFATSLINSIESLSNNLNFNNDLITNNANKNTNTVNNNLNFNPDDSVRKNLFSNNNNYIINNDFENNYIRSLQNSSINNANNFSFTNKNFNNNIPNKIFYATTTINNPLDNEKTPDMHHHSVFNANILNNKNNFSNNYSSYAVNSRGQYYTNNINQNNAFINSNIYDSNNFDKKFNNLNINSNSDNFAVKLNSNYHTSNSVINNLNISVGNNNNNNNYNYIQNPCNLSGKFKNFTNQLTKINLHDFNNQFNSLSCANSMANTQQKPLVAPSKNQTLQEQINLINLSYEDTQFNSTNKSQIEPHKPNLLHNSITKNQLEYENNNIAEKLIFFTTEQYRQMLNVFLNIDYGKDIIQDFHLNSFDTPPILLNHSITERMRSKMVDWMIEVTENYRCDQATYFLSVDIMDKFFCYSNSSLKPDELHVIGVCCMFIASKYLDIFPIKLASASEKISHGKISKEEIKSFEEKILKTLNYNLSSPTVYDFVNFFVEEIFNIKENNYNIKNEILRDYVKEHNRNIHVGKDIKFFDKNYYEKFTKTKIYDSKLLNFLRKVLLYLCKMNCFDVAFSTIKPGLIAGSTLFLGVKICEHILQTTYITDYFIENLIQVSNASIEEIYLVSEKQLENSKNFEKNHPNLENLKKFSFDFMNN